MELVDGHDVPKLEVRPSPRAAPKRATRFALVCTHETFAKGRSIFSPSTEKWTRPFQNPSPLTAHGESPLPQEGWHFSPVDAAARGAESRAGASPVRSTLCSGTARERRRTIRPELTLVVSGVFDQREVAEFLGDERTDLDLSGIRMGESAFPCCSQMPGRQTSFRGVCVASPFGPKPGRSECLKETSGQHRTACRPNRAMLWDGGCGKTVLCALSGRWRRRVGLERHPQEGQGTRGAGACPRPGQLVPPPFRVALSPPFLVALSPPFLVAQLLFDTNNRDGNGRRCGWICETVPSPGRATRRSPTCSSRCAQPKR